MNRLRKLEKVGQTFDKVWGEDDRMGTGVAKEKTGAINNGKESGLFETSQK